MLQKFLRTEGKSYLTYQSIQLGNCLELEGGEKR